VSLYAGQMYAMNINALSAWVDQLQGSGRYSFLRLQAIDATGLSAEAVRKSLQRLAKRKRVAKVKDYFYVIVPIEYVNAGAPPTPWYVADLMQAIGQPYYVGLLSAAALHGASHHQPQEFQIITSGPQRPLHVARQRIRFFEKRSMEETPVTEVKTPTGFIRVSSPEATALDLVRYSKAAGHLGNVATVLGDLAERMKPDVLLNTAEKQDDIPTAQRLGFLLDLIEATALADPLAAYIAKKRPRAVRLRTDHPVAGASQNKRWRVYVNETVEAEL
jgi:predicted transcriptional regulator of viral defense system